MALAVDSFQHLVALFQKDLHERCNMIVKGLAIIGAIYVTKKVVQTAIYCYSDIKTYGFAKLWKTPLHKYGSWAVVTGCENFMIAGFVNELALNGLNVMLIGSESCLPKETINRRVNVKIEHIIIDYNNISRNMKVVNSALANKDIGIFICSASFKNLSEKAFDSLTYEEISELTQMNVEYITQMYRIALAYMTCINKNGGAIVTITPSHPAPSSLNCAWMAYIKLLQSKLRKEYRNKNVEFLNLVPYEITISKRHKWKILDLLKTSPESYARSALTVVGWTSQTTGHFFHQLQMRVSSVRNAVLGAFAFQIL